MNIPSIESHYCKFMQSYFINRSIKFPNRDLNSNYESMLLNKKILHWYEKSRKRSHTINSYIICVQEKNYL